MSSTAATVQPTDQSVSNPLVRVYGVMFIGLIAASFAAVTIRLAQINGLPSPLIAAGRLSLAALILTPFVLRAYRSQLRNLSRDDLLWALGAGFFIGVHFILLNYALENTSVMVGQVMVNTGPLWVALLETSFLGVRLARSIYLALLLTLVGGAIIAVASSVQVDTTAAATLIQTGGLEGIMGLVDTRDPILGAILALAAAIAAATYMTIGRKVRAKVALIPYIWMVYGAGGLTAFVFVFFSGTAVTGHPTMGYVFLILLTLGPQLTGHSSFNYAVGYLSATLVSISTQSIAISATIIAFLLFAEVPLPLEIAGSLVVASGVAVAILGGRKRAG